MRTVIHGVIPNITSDNPLTVRGAELYVYEGSKLCLNGEVYVVHDCVQWVGGDLELHVSIEDPCECEDPILDRDRCTGCERPLSLGLREVWARGEGYEGWSDYLRAERQTEDGYENLPHDVMDAFEDLMDDYAAFIFERGLDRTSWGNTWGQLESTFRMLARKLGVRDRIPPSPPILNDVGGSHRATNQTTEEIRP